MANEPSIYYNRIYIKILDIKTGNDLTSVKSIHNKASLTKRCFFVFHKKNPCSHGTVFKIFPFGNDRNYL